MVTMLTAEEDMMYCARVVVLMVAAVGVLINAAVAELGEGTATGRPTTRT